VIINKVKYQKFKM